MVDHPDHHEHPSELNWDFIYLAYDVLVQLVRKIVKYILFITVSTKQLEITEFFSCLKLPNVFWVV